MTVHFRLKFNLLVITKSGLRRTSGFVLFITLFFLSLSQNYVKERSCIYYVLTIICIHLFCKCN
jgi:hypothetical protein